MVPAALATLVLSLASTPPTEQVLFSLARSTNANVVDYSVRVRDDGGLARDPFDVHWRMLARDGHREGLTFFENQWAYGLSSRATGAPDTYAVSLAACRDRPLVVRRTDRGYEAQLVLNGVLSRLRRIFVQAIEGSFPPRVAFVELVGESLADGSAISERIVPR